ncbi:MAG: hypothetical protein IPL42_09685 [Saprospiraceae bacterium]|nr:hypothetical protein [Saprospiraceae bacterium]
MRTNIRYNLIILFTIIICLSKNNLNAQSSVYKITYNKETNNIEYSVGKIRNGLEYFAPLNNKPRLTKGDIIQIDVLDYNIFKLNINIETLENNNVSRPKDKYQNPLLFLLNQVSGFKDVFLENKSSNDSLINELRNKLLEANRTMNNEPIEINSYEK